MRSSTSVSQANGSTPFSFALAVDRLWASSQHQDTVRVIVRGVMTETTPNGIEDDIYGGQEDPRSVDVLRPSFRHRRDGRRRGDDPTDPARGEPAGQDHCRSRSYDQRLF